MGTRVLSGGILSFQNEFVVHTLKIHSQERARIKIQEYGSHLAWKRWLWLDFFGVRQVSLSG